MRVLVPRCVPRMQSLRVACLGACWRCRARGGWCGHCHVVAAELICRVVPVGVSGAGTNGRALDLPHVSPRPTASQQQYGGQQGSGSRRGAQGGWTGVGEGEGQVQHADQGPGGGGGGGNGSGSARASQAELDRRAQQQRDAANQAQARMLAQAQAAADAANAKRPSSKAGLIQKLQAELQVRTRGYMRMCWWHRLGWCMARAWGCRVHGWVGQ